MAKLVDALDLGSSAARYGGSSPFIRTMFKMNTQLYVGCFYLKTYGKLSLDKLEFESEVWTWQKRNGMKVKRVKQSI